jgi:hypothetical protein
MKVSSKFGDLISTNEGRAELAGIAVVLGLLLEVFLAFKFRTHKSPLEEWGPLLADALIAAGVFLELYFGRKASNESDQRVAAANERAAKAELAAQELRGRFAWRAINAEQKTKLREMLHGKVAEKIWVQGLKTDPEAEVFFSMVFDSLKYCELDINGFTGWERLSGLRISHFDTPPGIALREAFQSIGYKFHPMPADATHYPGKGGLAIFVGSKEPVFLQENPGPPARGGA